MPIEIGELIVTATIVPDDASGTQSEGSTPISGMSFDEEQKEQLIRECVEQVMELIRQQTQR